MADQFNPKVQATEVTYELHSLGWKAFQHLCGTIIRVIWSQVAETFADSKDAGRDGAFHGTWAPKEGEPFNGSFVVQCKYTGNPNKSLSFSDLKGEIPKAKRLANRGLADNYLVLTDYSVTGSNHEKLKVEFESITKIKNFAAYGREWISQIIHENPKLRMLVPQVYGLGDLTHILDERAYSQAKAVLDSWGDDLKKFVVTDAYKKSAESISENGFVFLLGEPASGKSTIAALLAVGAIDKWQCPTVKARNAEDFASHWNPNEPKQFFWIDDVFGTTQLDLSCLEEWNRTFPLLNAAVRKGARVLFTSRDYIYAGAMRAKVKKAAFPLLDESKVVINVEEITREERRQIVYNHIKLGDQPKTFKKKLKPLLETACNNSKFSPELARRLGSTRFTKKLNLTDAGLKDFIEHPVELLIENIKGLDADSRSGLGLIFMGGGVIPSPLLISDKEKIAIRRMGSVEEKVISALETLKGSFVIQPIDDSNYVWRFKHATIRDAMAVYFAENPELMDIYLAGTPIKKILEEVSCGDVGIQGVKVIVPSNRYEAVLTRIDELNIARRFNKWVLYSFLNRRCDLVFLKAFLTRNPAFVSTLEPESPLEDCLYTSMAVRLHKNDLLPEEDRVRIVRVIGNLAVETPDPGFLDPDIGELLTEDEKSSIINKVDEVVLPYLDEVVERWRSDYDRGSGEDAESYFYPLKATFECFETYLSEYAGISPWASHHISEGISYIDEAIAELESEKDDNPGWEDDDIHEYNFLNADGAVVRSIFDDIDE